MWTTCSWIPLFSSVCQADSLSPLYQGKRYSMPNARIMIHQPLGGASGQAVDIEIQAREIMYHKANINRIMADYTGQPIEKARVMLLPVAALC